VTQRRHLRSGLLSAALVALVVVAWLLLAPTRIGGETTYVSTSGISMEPRFHAGAGTAYNPARPPIDVTTIEALVQLAERSERLILHHQHDGVDTYLVDDEGTLYRYQPRPAGPHQPPALTLVDDVAVEGATGWASILTPGRGAARRRRAGGRPRRARSSAAGGCPSS
jgi:hypothetical protein